MCLNVVLSQFISWYSLCEMEKPRHSVSCYCDTDVAVSEIVSDLVPDEFEIINNR